MRKECSLIGAALDIGQKKLGPELAPSWLRVNGLKETLESKFFLVKDNGNLSTSQENCFSNENPDVFEKLGHLSNYAQHLSRLISSELEEEKFVLTVGGDHSLAAGTLAATLKYNKDMKIVWVDAHADINTPETSPSQNTHGMPVALAMKLVDDPKISDLFKFIPELKPENIVYLGLRDVDPGEQKFLDKLNIRHYTSEQILKKGIKQVMDETLEYLDPHEDAQFHLSFDVDGIDPQFFPSTGTPVGGGLDLFQGCEIIKTLSKTGRMVAMDLVEVNPLLGNEEDLKRTAQSARELIDALSVQFLDFGMSVEQRAQV